MRMLASVLCVAVSGGAIAAIPVAPATPEVVAAAREVVGNAFSSPDALRRTKMPADGLGIGPRLWAASVKTRKPFAKDTKDTYAMVNPAIIAKWTLASLDLATITDPTLHATITEAAKTGGTPVVAGGIMRRGDVILPALVLDQVKPDEFPFSVRRPTESELEYYYSLIPYDLTEPILVVESTAHAFLCHVDKDTKLFYFEML
jgi:hypothetical protein